MLDAFICYVPEDIEFANNLAELLTQDGLEVEFKVRPHLDIDWKALASCDFRKARYAVVIVSPAFVAARQKHGKLRCSGRCDRRSSRAIFVYRNVLPAEAEAVACTVQPPIVLSAAFGLESVARKVCEVVRTDPTSYESVPNTVRRVFRGLIVAFSIVLIGTMLGLILSAPLRARMSSASNAVIEALAYFSRVSKPVSALVGLAPTPSAWTRPTDEMVMVRVPGGQLQMGSNDTDLPSVLAWCSPGDAGCTVDSIQGERPVHQVTVADFWLDRTEVTTLQFARFVRATDYRTAAETEGFGWQRTPEEVQVTGANWRNPSGPDSTFFGRMNNPAVQVSWKDAAAYCEWAQARLPTEAEWEYAARGPEGRRFPWGNEINLADAPRLMYRDNLTSNGKTTTVGIYPTGASWCGALDLAGNAWEWLADWYGPYTSEPQAHPTGPAEGDRKVVRGGSWRSSLIHVRSANRQSFDPNYRSDDLGFRCASTE